MLWFHTIYTDRTYVTTMGSGYNTIICDVQKDNNEERTIVVTATIVLLAETYIQGYRMIVWLINI